MLARSLVIVVAAVLLGQGLARAEDVPQNGWVVWESNRADGRREVYFMKADGTGTKRLTTTGARIPRSALTAWSTTGTTSSGTRWCGTSDGTQPPPMWSSSPLTSTTSRRK